MVLIMDLVEFEAFWSSFGPYFLGLEPLFQLLIMVGVIAVVSLVITLVYYLIKGVLYLIYYTLKAVVYITYYSLKGVYLLLKAMVKIAVKILEKVGDFLDSIFNRDITPEKVGAQMEAITVPKTIISPKFCPICGNAFDEIMDEVLHKEGHAFCQSCGAKAEIH